MYPVGGSNYLDTVLFATVDLEVLIELKERADINVMEACFVASWTIISVCVLF